MTSPVDRATSRQRSNDTPDGRVVYSWSRNNREEVRATLRDFKGLRLADVRVWAADADDIDRPTKKGLCIQVRDLPKLLAAVQALIEAEKAA